MFNFYVIVFLVKQKLKINLIENRLSVNFSFFWIITIRKKYSFPNVSLLFNLPTETLIMFLILLNILPDIIYYKQNRTYIIVK